MLYPLLFKATFFERIWGGRNLESLYAKALPPAVLIGESWEISDRPEAQSEILNGPLAGRTLEWLMTNHQRDLLGQARPLRGRFPLLVKILDAEQTLSLQVHPPVSKAELLGGEPKTEMWYITATKPNAELYVGLKKGMTREAFELSLSAGSVANCFHRIQVKPGDAMFLPSGRVHAIGTGLVLFEIQQNSDTTYRVFDWNRRDSAGNLRQLHVKESLACIDFNDFEPKPIHPESPNLDDPDPHAQRLVEDPLFTVEIVSTRAESNVDYDLKAPRVVGVVEGSIRIPHPENPVELQAGQFCLMPAALKHMRIESLSAAKILVAQPGF